jgi:hypothetical protein
MVRKIQWTIESVASIMLKRKNVSLALIRNVMVRCGVCTVLTLLGVSM